MRGLSQCCRAAVIACLAGALLPAGVLATACDECHSDPRFMSHNRMLYDYYQDWTSSPHKNAGVSCEACHGGDPDAPTKEGAHVGMYPVDDPRSKVYYSNQPETCSACHPLVVEQFVRSPHYKALVDEKAAPNCSTCHRAMNRKPYAWDIVDVACKSCHSAANSDAPQGVAEKAREILHRINIIRAYLGWTSVYYESHGWPGESRERVRRMRERYHDLLSRGHSLNLGNVNAQSTELLADLKQVFGRAWSEKEQDHGTGSAPEPPEGKPTAP